MNEWLLLILSLPTENATARMRAWRALRNCGAAVLRDGVYLLPDRADCVALLQTIANDVAAHDGSARLLRCDGHVDFPALFDRTADYGALVAEVALVQASLTRDSVADIQKQARKLRKALSQIIASDFFAGVAQQQAAAALLELEEAAVRVVSPGEPHAVALPLARCDLAQFQQRVWATRQRPWVDRLASAWLIRRFIDPAARFLWLPAPQACPPDAVGFDFDGATFSHVDARVTFETLLASFGLDTIALQRIAAVVHHLDVGGMEPPESRGIERVLAGMRDQITDDDQLLAVATTVFDGLLAAFSTETPA